MRERIKVLDEHVKVVRYLLEQKNPRTFNHIHENLLKNIKGLSSKEKSKRIIEDLSELEAVTCFQEFSNKEKFYWFFPIYVVDILCLRRNTIMENHLKEIETISANLPKNKQHLKFLEIQTEFTNHLIKLRHRETERFKARKRVGERNNPIDRRFIPHYREGKENKLTRGRKNEIINNINPTQRRGFHFIRPKGKKRVLLIKMQEDNIVAFDKLHKMINDYNEEGLKLLKKDNFMLEDLAGYCRDTYNLFIVNYIKTFKEHFEKINDFLFRQREV